MANIFSIISTKFYQNRFSFVNDVIKIFGVVFGFTVPIAVHLQNTMLVSQGSVATLFR